MSKLKDVRNITLILLFWLIGLLMGIAYGYNYGKEDINNRLVVSVWSEAYTQGYIKGGASTLYMIFEDYVNSSPYKLEE